MTSVIPSNGLQRRNTTSSVRQHVGAASHAAAPTKYAPQQPASIVPSDSDLLCRTLRLLDLDLLPDWPDVKPSIFRSANDPHITQKDRIRTAEWVLFRLLERWSQRETKARLGPLFPAFEPLQSIRLRAALLQWLTDLKGQGVLGKECMIRKSMFDECKGEKFEEVLLHLSTAVLRKAVRGRHSRKGEIAAAQRLCLTSGWSAANESNVDILVYAHEASTRRVLRDRTLRRCMLSTLNSDLLASRSSLQQERELVNRELSQQQAKLNGAKVDPQAMRKRLIQHNQEDTRWLNIAMSGDLEHGRDAMVEDKYEKLWMNAMELEEPVAYEPIPTSLLANLEQRVKLQQDRLARWRRFQNELSKRNEDLLIAQSPAKTPFKSPLKKLGSPYKSSPRRIASTRKPERAANVTMTSTWLQSLQASPIKPQSGSAKLAEAEAWDAMKSLQPPLSLQRQKTSSKTLEDDTEILCADVTDMQVSSESPASPIRETSTRTQQHRSRLPSLSKTAAKQPQNASDERISNSVTNSAAADRGIAGVPANTKDENPDDRIDEAVPMTEESSPTPQTPLETLMERTAKTMAEWQQKATTKAQPSGNASRSRTGSSATASPRKHKHTRSIPVVSTPRRSPERVTDADRAKAFAPQLDGFTNGEYAPGSPSPISAAPASLLSDSPAPADRTDQELYSTEGVPALKTAHPSAQLEFGDPTVNDESPFKPRNRLRRTPPVSPAALD